MKRKLMAQGALLYIKRAAQNMQAMGINDAAIAIDPAWYEAIIQELGLPDGNPRGVVRLCIHHIWIYPAS